MEVGRETQVWQRVAAPITGGQSREELRILLQNAGERSALFQTLTGQVPRGREQLRQLKEIEMANTACIKGMLAFSGWETQLPIRSPGPVSVRQTLVRGYYLAKKAAAEYTARSVDPEFGVVYQEMANRERKACELITQLLGAIS